eukprot:UN34139
MKLHKSNTAGIHYRDKVNNFQSEIEYLKQSQSEMENQNSAKDHLLEEYRASVKTANENLKNQEVVFKLQLQEMGHLIDEMQEREKRIN